jgi:surface antigen
LIQAFKSVNTSTTLAYTGVFALTITLVATGYQSQQAQDTAADRIKASTTSIVAEPAHVDETTALHIASDIAIAANLAVAKNIANMSTSLDIQAQMSQNSKDSIDKPLLVRAIPYSRGVETYVTKEGDTVEKIAKQHNITAQTVKWANNLTDDTVEKGKDLVILPLDGILYTVKEGDTLKSITEKYAVDQTRVASFNDLERSEVKNGQQLVLPEGILPEEERPGYVAPAPVAAQVSVASVAPAAPVITQPTVDTSAGNTYAFGNCTSWAYERRMQLGRPIGSNWGNAATWNIFASQQGFVVNNIPEAGAVYQMPAFIDAYTGAYGHVGIVESVNGDGSVNVSEMNYAGGFNRVSYRTIPAAQAAIYNYIH